MDLELQGKRALVTGGSRGIGKAIARALALEGVEVAILARTEAALRATASELATASGRKIVAVVADTADDAQVAGAIAEAVRQLGGGASTSSSTRLPSRAAMPRPRDSPRSVATSITAKWTSR